MKFSDDVEAALGYIETSGAALRKRSDIGIILECGAETCDPQTINAIIFHGKNAWSIYSILRRMRQNESGFQNMEREFMSSINALRTLLADLSAIAPPESKTRFNDVYFGNTQGTLRNLADLAHDLAILKNMQNMSKHDTSNSAESENNSVE
ncbi:MAG: hypothetical protein IT283_10035 [Bacteroidetes bacterium]|nr:hypothetical protein [Bacteroidota bacterium]MCZ2102413.1 hypothetical protein [Chitinophagales bacterium]